MRPDASADVDTADAADRQLYLYDIASAFLMQIYALYPVLQILQNYCKMYRHIDSEPVRKERFLCHERKSLR